jgi:signal transduction histidine kinase/CheY-like chemotaxis protein
VSLPTVSSRLFLGALLASPVLIAVYFVLPLEPQLVYYQVFAVAALLMVLVGIRLHRPARRRPWLLLAAMLALNVVADTYYNVLSLILDIEVPYPSIGEVLYLAGYACLAAAAVSFVHVRGDEAWVRSATLLDAMILSAGVAFPTWVFVIQPNAVDASSTMLERAVTIAYPTMDLVAFGALMLLLLAGGRNRALSVLLAGMALFVATDLVYGVLSLDGQYEDGMWLDAGWILGYLLFGLAALHPSMRVLEVRSAPTGPLTTRRLSALTLAVGSIPIVVAFGDTDRASLAAGSATIVVLVLLRLLVERRRFAQFTSEVAEQTRIAESIRHAQKMEALGRLAGGVAHDFNNLLTAMRGYADLLSEELAGNPHLQAEADEIRRAGDRAADLTRQLLAFSRTRIEPGEPAQVDLVLAETERMLRRLVGERFQLLVANGVRDVVVTMNASALEQALVNLVVNARDAMSDGGAIWVESSTSRIGDAPAVRVRVTDSGSGIPPEILGRVFEPFFTTKAASDGTGLGLSTVYAAVQDCGGTITVESDPGHGTRFDLLLPVVANPATGTAAPGSAPSIASRAATVMLVEDETAIRGLMGTVLKRAGHCVIDASNGREGLELADALPAPPDLLVSDVIMPEVGGVDLARRLRGRWPTLPILFVSGYTEHLLSTTDLEELQAGFLEKPFTAPAFLEQVDAVLAAVAAADIR